MNITKCDGCEAMSPDDSGLFKANNWFDVSVEDRSLSRHISYPAKDYVFCRECMGYKTRAESPHHTEGSKILGVIRRFCVNVQDALTPSR